MKYKTKSSAIDNVKRIFSNTPADSVSLQDAFQAWGRDLEKFEENKSWLSNIMTHLKYHNLIVPTYSSKTGYRKLDKLQLTLEGKKALGRTDGNYEHDSTLITNPMNDNHIPLDIKNVMRMVSQLRKENPDYEIMFDVKLKNK